MYLVSMTMLALSVGSTSLSIPMQAQKETVQGSGAIPAVKTCQVGFLPSETKIAVATVPSGKGVSNLTATILEAKTGKAVLKVEGSAPVQDADSGDIVSHFDFTALRKAGDYKLVVDGVGETFPFTVGDKIFSRAFRLAVRSFTGLRSGIDVDLGPDFPQYKFKAGHTAIGKYHASSGKTGTRDISGGWYDAGDYGKYTVNSGITTGTMLLAFERNAAKIKGIKLDIPETGKSKLPDFLSEVKWNLDWMLKMQDEDGGAWHKATTAQFTGFVMPDQDKGDVLVIGTGKAPFKNTTATADLTAVAAIGARVFKAFDPAYSTKLLEVAKKGFAWCLKHPNELFTNNPQGIGTGGYGDGNAKDEVLWAAVELYRTTGDASYHDVFLKLAKEWKDTFSDTPAPGWPELRPLALMAYAQIKDRPVDKDYQATVKKGLEVAADAVAARVKGNGYLMPLKSSEYYWGSNGVIANYALVLQMAYSIHKKPAYRQAALDCLHHLFGRNLWGTSYVTHVGTKWAKRPHHRPSGADGIDEPWPGLLVGGPNAEGKNPPAREWYDEEASYRTNENAINWNAPLVFALAEFL